MIELVAYIRRNPALTREAFRAYWRNTHVPLIRSRLPGLRTYKGYLPVDEAEAEKLDADAVVILGFDDLATLREQMGSAAFNASDRVASSSHLIDLGFERSHLLESIDFLD